MHVRCLWLVSCDRVAGVVSKQNHFERVPMTPASGFPVLDTAFDRLSAAGWRRAVLAALSMWVFAVGGAHAQVPSVPGSAAQRETEPVFDTGRWHLPEGPMLGFVEIPAGSFPMGSNPLIDPMAFENERWSETRRQGAVDLPLFYVARYETTVDQFRAFMEAASYRVVEMSDLAAGTHPVSGVSWTDALAYARWLEVELTKSEQTPPELRNLLMNGWRLTLPDEAQWEKAARGTEPRIYPWGNSARKDRANFGSVGPVPVGSIACPECPYGLSDMSGNVWEWTRSPYLPYPFDPDNAAVNLQEDALWVMRGGSFNDVENNIRTAVRGAADPGARRPFIGFRLAIVRE
jgi:formylglycine-generating enzyme required for sulfatase activity